MKNAVIIIDGKRVALNDSISQEIISFAEDRGFVVNYGSEEQIIDLAYTDFKKRSEFLNYVSERLFESLDEKDFSEDEYVAIYGKYASCKRIAEHFYKALNFDMACRFCKNAVYAFVSFFT